MIKNVSGFFVVLITISFLSLSFVGKDTPTEGLNIGDRAPEFKICGEKQLMNLKDLHGKYVLLSFWASYDAPSRTQNATLNYAVSQANNVEMVSGSMSTNPSSTKPSRKTESPPPIVLWSSTATIRKCSRLIAYIKALRISCSMKMALSSPRTSRHLN